MRYVAFATDYDGTLAEDGRVDPQTVEALERLKASGRKLILITGRELEDLFRVFPGTTEFFDIVVAENGALLYETARRTTQLLAEPPPPELRERLAARGVAPLSAGQVILATREPYEIEVLDEIRALGLEMQVIFNKGAVMVLPSGVNKATGLKAALDVLGLSPHNAVAIGDAENDHALLTRAECGVAVADALPMLRERADLVMRGGAGAGVRELIEALLGDDLLALTRPLPRHEILLGRGRDGRPVGLAPAGHTLLFAGPSGSGKSTAAKGFVERLMEAGYQCCILDPEGDYQTFGRTVTLGDARRPPTTTEVLRALSLPGEQVVVNLLAVPLADRPAFFDALLPRLVELRARTGRPHWIVIDETHHLLPASWKPAGETLPRHTPWGGLVLITLVPHELARPILERVDVVVTVGEEPQTTIGDFCAALGLAPPPVRATLERGEVLLWRRSSGALERVQVEPPEEDHQRHVRKYAEGQLGPDRSFYFRGPRRQLNLRAQNLILFNQIADGVDDETWLHHLRRGDYSRWFREGIKDPALAAEAEVVERDRSLSARESRERIRSAVEARYTLPATSPAP